MTDTSGLTSLMPYAYYDRTASCLRMSQGTFPWDSIPCSVTSPPRGSMRNGACYELPMSERATDAPGCSSLLPTPRASPNENRQTRRTPSQEAGTHGLSLAAEVNHLLPTPVVNDMGEGKTVDRWDEWTAEMQERHGNGNGHGRSLAIEAMRLLPTPTARDHKDGAGTTWHPEKCRLPHTIGTLPTGVSTPLPSPDGLTSSEDPPPHQPTLTGD
jgi:hypothetical protein